MEIDWREDMVQSIKELHAFLKHSMGALDSFELILNQPEYYLFFKLSRSKQYSFS